MIPNTSIEPDAILSGMGALNLRALVAPEPGGFVANSRWLRSAATTPPDDRRIHFRIQEGCQPCPSLAARVDGQLEKMGAV